MSTKVKIIKTDNRKYWQESGETGLSYIAGGTVKWYSLFRKQPFLKRAVSQKVEPKVIL